MQDEEGMKTCIYAKTLRFMQNVLTTRNLPCNLEVLFASMFPFIRNR